MANIPIQVDPIKFGSLLKNALRSEKRELGIHNINLETYHKPAHG